MPRLNRIFCAVALALSTGIGAAQASTPAVYVSVPDQKLVVVQNGLRLAQFPISTSKFGVGDRPRSFATPLGTMVIASKVGDKAPLGTVFKGKRPTGEVLRPNAPGRDPIVTRILHLRGLESKNARAYSRGIYIHGTAEERLIGRPASYGCIRMRSRDVVKLYDALPVGTKVAVLDEPLHQIFRDTVAN